MLYGAAEFSRDTDLNVLASPENLEHLTATLAELQATCIAVPPWNWDYLARGHAIHFRCAHPETDGMRIDVMATLRGVAPFEELWERRTSVEMEDGLRIEVLGLPDLVLAKKTQRDKDWPMIRRLLEANYKQHRDSPTAAQVDFWLREARTASLLADVALKHPSQAAAVIPSRPLVALASQGNSEAVDVALAAEEKTEREADRAYWTPLRAELEQMRKQRRK